MSFASSNIFSNTLALNPVYSQEKREIKKNEINQLLGHFFTKESANEKIGEFFFKEITCLELESNNFHANGISLKKIKFISFTGYPENGKYHYKDYIKIYPKKDERNPLCVLAGHINSQHRVLIDNEKKNALQNQFEKFLSGNCIFKSFKHSLGFLPIQDPALWVTSWRKDNSFLEENYRNIDLRILALVATVLFQNLELPCIFSKEADTKMRIVEFFGGQGELAHLITSVFAKAIDYIHTDKYEKVISIAKEKFSDNLVDSFAFDAVEDAIDPNRFPQPVNMVIASGGTTIKVIETFEQAKTALEKMFNLLAPGGLLVLSGENDPFLPPKVLAKTFPNGTLLNCHDVRISKAFIIMQKTHEG